MNETVESNSAENASNEGKLPSDERLPSFKMAIATGMLESLGLNMYTSIGKSLSEFVANAYDADAENVDISIPFDRIDLARAELRNKAKAEVAAGTRDKFTVLVDPLPEDIQITITDNGHGMLPIEIRDKLLIVSRNRRSSTPKTESGARFAMGRKGLGKLAGFGTAEKITIESKREGKAFETSFTMDYAKIETAQRVDESRFEAIYKEPLAIDVHGTRIVLSALRCDSLKASEDTIRDILAQNFAMLGETFTVTLNSKIVSEPEAEYEFTYPPVEDRDADGMGAFKVEVNDMLDFDIKYLVRFRARETDGEEPKTGGDGRPMKRGNLPAGMRGARIYCNKRLAAGPTLLNLHTGMHNFHAQAYMECIVHADVIDQQTVDHIGTNRADLKGDSEVVEALRDTVTEIMRVALREHAKFRDTAVGERLEKDEFTQGLLVNTRGLSKDVRQSAHQLLKSLAAVNGTKSEFYRSAAPLVLESMNAGSVLAKLIDLEHDPKSLPVLAHGLLELARIENRDVLKLYRGRRNGIDALRQLIDRSRTNWKSGKRFENDLQLLLKDNPWLIQPDFSRYLTSDRPLGDVAKELTGHLKIDEAAAKQTDDDGNISDESTRPDLVFVMADSETPNIVTIVELKTPNYPLRIEHLNQLDKYVLNVEDWLAAKYTNPPRVRGILIGDTDSNSKVAEVNLLNKKMKEFGPGAPIEIIPLPELLERTKRVHTEAIEAAQKNEDFLNDELSTDSVVKPYIVDAAKP